MRCQRWSDDDSVMSSQASDYDSPRPAAVTPRSIHDYSVSDAESTDILTATPFASTEPVCHGISL